MAVEVIAPTGEVEVRGRRWEAVVATDTSEVRVESGTAEIDVSTGILAGGTPYEGEYTVTPGEERQILPTGSKLMGQDMVIEPIPSNYGRITYNGSVITVS